MRIDTALLTIRIIPRYLRGVDRLILPNMRFLSWTRKNMAPLKRSVGHMGNIDSCCTKGNKQMFTRAASRLVCAVAVVLFGYMADNSFALDEAKALALSKALSQVKLFAGLTDAERNALKAAATLRRGKAGERIIRQGKILDRMFIILENKVEVRVNGKPVVTLSGQPLIGEIEFLDKLPAAADVLLLKETDLIELNYATLTGLMEKQPRLGYVLMLEIAKIEAQRLRKTTQK